MSQSRISIFNTFFCNGLREKLGNPCLDFLEENQVNLLILTKRLLKLKFPFVPVVCLDYSFVLTPSIKAFEGYLEKLIQEKNLRESENDGIGTVFGGKKKDKVFTKLRDAKIYRDVPGTILTEWNRCRGRVLHYNPTFFLKTVTEAEKRYEQILEIIKESYEAYFEESVYIPPKKYLFPPPKKDLPF